MNELVLQEARQLMSGFLKNRRNELGMSQDKLAELSGIGIATIRRFESGKFWLNLKQYLIICHHLKCYPFLAESDSEHPLAKDMREVINKVNSFNKKCQPCRLTQIKVYSRNNKFIFRFFDENSTIVKDEYNLQNTNSKPLFLYFRS